MALDCRFERLLHEPVECVEDETKPRRRIERADDELMPRRAAVRHLVETTIYGFLDEDYPVSSHGRVYPKARTAPEKVQSPAPPREKVEVGEDTKKSDEARKTEEEEAQVKNSLPDSPKKSRSTPSTTPATHEEERDDVEVQDNEQEDRHAELEDELTLLPWERDSLRERIRFSFNDDVEKPQPSSCFLKILMDNFLVLLGLLSVIAALVFYFVRMAGQNVY